MAAPGGDPNVDLNGDGFSDGVFQESYCNPGSWILLLNLHFDEFCTIVMSGTSMASPHVAGLAALLLGEDASLSPDDVRGIMEGTARDRGAAGWDPLYGWGLVDAFAAVSEVTDGDPDPTAIPTDTPGPTDTPAPTDTPTSTDTPTPTFTPQPDTPTPTPTHCPQGWIKKGLCGGTGATPTFTPTPTPGGGGATPTPTPCSPGWIKQGRC